MKSRPIARLLRSPIKRFAKGLTLIEMMVSITIGMIIVASIVAMYAGASGAGKMAEAQGRMNEDAQAALTILTQQIRMAGANPKQPNYTSATPRNQVFPAGSYALRGCDGTYSDVTTAANPQSLTCPNNTTATDSITVSYEADKYNTVPTTDGEPTDCVGSALTGLPLTVIKSTTPPATQSASITTTVAENRFYIKTPNSPAVPSLYCKGGASAEQPLVENIEDMQFTYGTSPASTRTGTVAGYLTATEIETDASLVALGVSPLRWARVMTVRICVLVRSEQPVAPTTASAQYNNCKDVLVVDPPDLRLRRAYYTTVVLRNRMP
jgi:type IV pilus assembly protein PilW